MLETSIWKVFVYLLPSHNLQWKLYTWHKKHQLPISRGGRAGSAVRHCIVRTNATTLKLAIAASSRNGTRIYPILWCHFMTQNQKLWCSPETFRLSFYGIQGVPKKIWAFDIPSLQGSRRKILFSTTDFQNMGYWNAKDFLKKIVTHAWKFQDCTTTFDSV